MLNFSAERTTFWAMLNFSPETSSFFVKKVLLSAEMLNMLDHVECLFPKMCFFLLKYWICWICWIILPQFGPIWPPIRPKKLQHIQHIQHFSRKKHIFQTLDPTWFNIFNISAERSTFSAHVEFFLLKEPLFGPCWIFSAERITFCAMLNFFPWNKLFLFKKVLLSAEMLNMLDHAECLFPKKCFLEAHFGWNVLLETEVR